jgi:hypothetical protein
VCFLWEQTCPLAAVSGILASARVHKQFKPFRAALGVAAAIVIMCVSSSAWAIDSYSAEYSWKPVMPLFGPGTALLLAGYVPVFGAALPTTLRAGATLFYDLGTVGLACDNGKPDYTCAGDFGAAQLLIPFVGPFLFADNHPKDSQINPHGLAVPPSTRTLLYVDGVMQITGATLMAIGLASGHWEHDARSTSDSSFTLTPMLGMGRAGLSLQIIGM